ncbi:MAG: type II secretion system protein GspH [Gammaproteobacteria bacterium]|jgi:general secretion pathway protein H|nr:type II secretion system protein GspH [Gammaproteobacteria bacterium]
MAQMVSRAVKKTMPILGFNRARVGGSLQPVTGFTLLELLLVLAILGMAAVLVVPNLTGLESRTFNAQVRQATSLLNYARRIAVVTGQPSTASFRVGEDSSEEEDLAMGPAPVGRWDSLGTTLRFRDSTEREAEVEEKIEITFYPEGGSTGGTLLLSQAGQLANIIIDPFTGRVSAEIPEE